MGLAMPDDWNSYYFTCGKCNVRYHASFPECGCIDPPEMDLSDYDYEWHEHDREWTKVVSSKAHTARRDHSDGKIKKGERYRREVVRHIYDDGSGQYLKASKWKIKGSDESNV